MFPLDNKLLLNLTCSAALFKIKSLSTLGSAVNLNPSVFEGINCCHVLCEKDRNIIHFQINRLSEVNQQMVAKSVIGK
jgi:hypothetical protein